MRKLGINEVREKAAFLSKYLDYSVELEYGKENCYIWNNYGMKGSDCVFAGSLSKCNDYFNRALRKLGVVDEWKVIKNKSLTKGNK